MITKNAKSFYRFIKEKTEKSPTIPPLTDLNDRIFSTDLEKAELLANEFHKTFTGLPSTFNPTSSFTKPSLTDIVFTVSSVTKNT